MKKVGKKWPSIRKCESCFLINDSSEAVKRISDSEYLLIVRRAMTEHSPRSFASLFLR